MQKSDNRQRVSRYLKFHHFSWSSRTSGSWRISTLEKPVPMLSKTLSLDITRPYNLLTLIFRNFSSERLRQRPDRQQQEPINAEVNIYLNSWTKFPPINYQPATVKSSLTFNRQLSKWLKNSRQPSKLPPHWHLEKRGKNTWLRNPASGLGAGRHSLIYAIWVCAAPSGRVLRRFGLKTGIHFAHFGLKSGWVFEENSGEYEHFYRFNSK